ncbi:MAG TPA: SPFH domain-containing protein [Rhodocyclaceae bacterium]|nr:SPFH domain-containing protein [Rhodocyclaceae bacterium]
MFGIRFIKSQPTTYLVQFKGGKAVREGAGLSFFYYAPTTSLVAVPLASKDQSFIFEQVTADFQSVTVQGQITFRVGEPRKLAAMLNFSLKADGGAYESDDPEKLAERVVSAVEVLSKHIVNELPLKAALRAADKIATQVAAGLKQQQDIASLGLEILGVAIRAIKPTPETARALEAEAREAILKAADDAVFLRRNAAVENERAIRENELDTEIAVEQKRRSIRETQMEAEASIQRKQSELRQAEMDASVVLEEKRKEFVARNAENTRTLAEVEAHRLIAVMKAMEHADPRIVQALAAAGMQPNQLIAQAFGGIAEKAERIGQLNMSPDLLHALLTHLPDSRAPKSTQR